MVARVAAYILYHSPGTPSGPGVFQAGKEWIAALISSIVMALSKKTSSSSSLGKVMAQTPGAPCLTGTEWLHAFHQSSL